MFANRSRRKFLADVGRGVLVASMGSGLATELGFSSAAAAADGPEALNFGALESLVCLMQETSIDKLLPVLVERINAGVELKTLVAAAALANARTFGGEDYVGFHTLMALSPAYHMSQQLPDALKPLPVLKVLYRNTNRIQERGGRAEEVLHPVKPENLPKDVNVGELLREAVRRKEAAHAEAMFAGIAAGGADDAFNALLYAVQDNTEVHRVVLPYRAWDLLDLVGREQALTLLRQSVRYCLRSENGQRNPTWDEPRTVLPKLLEQYHLMDKSPGTRTSDDQWVEQFSQMLFSSTGQQAAEAAAAALADGIAPADIGQAISLAANQLILRDHGRTPEAEIKGKPLGSVHGDSIGVHACDSANAWRNMARVSNTRNTFACLILGAYQVAIDRVNRSGDFLNWKPLPLATHLDQVKTTDADGLLKEADAAIRDNLQARASAIIYRYGALGHPPEGAFGLMLQYATSEDGALHAEKYYRTVCEEFAVTRPAFRWRQLAALARVTASEYGRPAAGYAEARSLLKLG